jgi:RNA polymerase sigma factor (sigma-70 family)
VQTTFMYALGALRRGVVPTAESAWLLTIARNVCLSRFDAVRRRGRIELVRDPQSLAEIAAAPEHDDSDLLGLDEALARLPARQRRAIVLREWQGLSYAEIADELRLSTSAVETLLFRARRALARELRGEERDRRRRGLDLASLLGWAKSLLGAGAAKLAIGAAAVATVGVVAAGSLERDAHQPGAHGSPAPRAVAAVPKSQATGVAATAPARAAAHSPSSYRSAGRTPGRASAARQIPSGATQTPRAPATDAAAAPKAPAPPAQPGTPSPSNPARATTPAGVPPPSVPTVALPSDPLPTDALPTDPLPQLPAPSLPSPPPVSTPTLPAAPSVPPTPSVQVPDAPSTPALPSVPGLGG